MRRCAGRGGAGQGRAIEGRCIRGAGHSRHSVALLTDGGHQQASQRLSRQLLQHCSAPQVVRGRAARRPSLEQRTKPPIHLHSDLHACCAARYCRWCVGEYCAITEEGTKPGAGKKKKKRSSFSESFAVVRSSPKVRSCCVLCCRVGGATGAWLERGGLQAASARALPLCAGDPRRTLLCLLHLS